MFKKTGSSRRMFAAATAIAAVLSTAGIAANASEPAGKADTSAGAVAPQASFMLRSRMDGNRCLDVAVSNGGNGGAINSWECNGGGAQRWHWNGPFLVSDLSGRCLDVMGSNGGNGAALILFDCADVPARRWVLSGEMLVNGINGKCPAIDNANPGPGASVHMWDCVGVPHQKWYLDF